MGKNKNHLDKVLLIFILIFLSVVVLYHYCFWGLFVFLGIMSLWKWGSFLMASSLMVSWCDSEWSSGEVPSSRKEVVITTSAESLYRNLIARRSQFNKKYLEIESEDGILSYTVQEWDYLSCIAEWLAGKWWFSASREKKYFQSWFEINRQIVDYLIEYNHLEGENIRPWMVLKIPRGELWAILLEWKYREKLYKDSRSY